MEYIRYENKFRDIMGKPVTMIDPDIKNQKKAQDKAHAQARKDGVKIDSDLRWEQALIDEPTFADAMVIFANGIPYRKYDQDGKEVMPKEGEEVVSPRDKPSDQGDAIRVIRAFRAAQARCTEDSDSSYVEIEESSLKWLIDLVNDHADKVRTFRGTIPGLIIERLEDKLSAKEQAAIEENESTA